MRILLLIPILCISCADNSQDEDVLKFNITASLSYIDPAFANTQANQWVVGQLYEQLVTLDESLRPMPGISQSWEISEDGLRYRFKIRKGVRFSDGTEVRAEDVAFSFKRLTDPNLNAKGSWVFKGKVSNKEPFSTDGDSIFVLTLSKPFSPMLSLLASPYCGIVSKASLPKGGIINDKNCVGTGPFKPKLWHPGNTLILERNPHFPFPRNQKIKGIRYTFIRERQAAFFELTKGNVQLMAGIESSYSDKLLDKFGELRKEMASRLALVKKPYLNTEYLGFRTDSLPTGLQSKKVRQAMNFAIDRKTMLQLLRNGVGKPAIAGFIPHGLPSFDPNKVKGYDFNLERAKQLMAEAGFPKGEGAPAFTLYCNSDYADLCTFIAKQWEHIGLVCHIEVADGATVRAKRDNGSINFFRGSWLADYPDEENYLALFYGKNPSPPNYFRFKNKDYDELFEKSLETHDFEARKILYQQMDRILIEESPVIFLFYDESAWIMSNKVEYFEVNGMNIPRLVRKG